MTSEHFIKLIIPRINWFKNSSFDVFKSWRRLRMTLELRTKKKELIEKWIELKRKNTDDSIQEAFGVKKQVELLTWILESHNEL